MNEFISKEISELLQQTAKGDRVAFDQAFTLAYAELRRLAHQIRSGKPRTGMETTALVHECYLRLIRTPPESEGVSHFMAIVARAMRFLLIDEARASLMQKRKVEMESESAIDAQQLSVQRDAESLLELDDLLKKLETREPQQVRVIECRYFAGLNENDTSQALDLPIRTVQREWARAREWLAKQLG